MQIFTAAPFVQYEENFRVFGGYSAFYCLHNQLIVAYCPRKISETEKNKFRLNLHKQTSVII